MDSSYNKITGLLELTTTSTDSMPPILRLPALTDILINQSVYIIDYCVTTINSRSVNRPIIDGIALNSGRAGSTIEVATGRDYRYVTNESLGNSGMILYLSSNAIVSTTVPTIAAGDIWYVPVGRRLNEFNFIFDPQIPILLSTIPGQTPSPYPSATQDRIVIGESMDSLTAFRISTNGLAYIVTSNDDNLPIIDGITLESGGIDSSILVARIHNQNYETPIYYNLSQTYWLGTDGSLSPTRPSNAKYQVIVGRSIGNSNRFIFDSQTPIRLAN